MADVFSQIFFGIKDLMSHIYIFNLDLWTLSIGFGVLGLAVSAFHHLYGSGGDN